MQIERRKFTRFDIPLTVELKGSNEGERLFSGTTVNFSRSGICLKIEEAVPGLTGAVDLKVKLPEKDMYVHAAGDVLWTDCTDNQCFVGIKLIAMNQEAKFYILNYCHNVQ